MNPEEVLTRVRELGPGLRVRARDAEDRRNLPDETVKELKETGLVRLLQPARFGGYEAEPRFFYEACLAVAAACGSTGWVAGVVGVHPWQIAQWDDAAQQEVWGDDPDTWVSSSYMPVGRLTEVTDGFRLSGRWSFSSGCNHCQWVILGCLEERDGAPPVMWNALIPRSDYRIDDVWDPVGLRGTGSNDIVVEDAFVPSRRMLNVPEMFQWNSPGLAVNTNPLYRMPFASMFANAITVSIIGMGEGMLEEILQQSKSRVSLTWGPASSDPHLLSAIGQAASDLSASRAQLLQNIGAMYEVVRNGEPIPMGLRRRCRRDQVAGSQRAIQAIDACYDRAGAGAISMSSPLQRFWKDAHTGRHHTINSIEHSFADWALTEMGFDSTDVMI